ncbi:RAVE protein 1 C terminal-domain-containing protein [Thamnidium elegans]|nr:RAVE protein 1 C terminal-domain-containing protein [Thamnidium elegans]
MASWASEPHVVVSASQWATNTASRLFHRLSFQQKHVLTVTVGTDVICYGVNTEQETVEWEVIYTLDTSCLNGQIRQVRCSPSIVSIVSGTDDNQKLSIWMEMRSGMAPVCVKEFEFNQRVCDMAWNVTSDAQFILAVAFPSSVGIFGQKRAKSVTEDINSWICYTEFKVDTPEDITALAWVDCGVLTVAAGNQLRCYLKWLTEEDSVAKQIHSPENAKIEPMSSIFDISFEMNGPLPFYHPDHIIHYVMWGKMDLVHCALISLNNFFKQFVDDDDNIINEFPPVSFPKMLKLQNEKKLKSSDKQQYTSLFDEESDTEIRDNNDVDEDDDIVRHLTANEAKNLAHSLKTKILPGLNETERVHLIAMVDTIVEITNQGESLDENGARFTALLENHFHLNKVLPQDQRQSDLQPCDFVWALHSQSQDLLLERCVRLCGTKFVWEDAKSLGIFLWLQKIDVVREQMSNIARNIYLSKTDDRDPADCTLFYLALRKKNLLQGLWRSASSHKEQTIMKKFLANDFNDPRWQRAASKNAFALLGRQRFEYAASFFLLADKLKDAVNVILKNMKDYQLAIAICRVYDGDDSPLLKEILENSIIPMAIETNDRWLISIGFWLLNNQKDSVRAMVVPLSQFTDKHIDTTEKDSAEIVYHPNSFILYQYLKKKLHQQNLVVSYQTEYEFSLLVSRSYERLGLPLLALYILTKYYMKPPIKQETTQDLFNSEPIATDLFADDKPSRASDLFANDDTDLFAPSKATSYATDLFADDDLFSPKKPSGGLFDDDDDLFAPKKTSSGLFDEDDLFASDTRAESNPDTEDDEISLSERCYDGLDGYKALLVIRMLQTFFHAASALYSGLDTPDHVHEIRYQSHFLRNRQALLDLGESVKVSPYVFSRLLMEKSIETDVFPLYLYILNESVPKDFDVHQFLRAFKVGCFEYVLLNCFNRHVIKTFPIWNELRRKYCNPETAALTSRQIALTTYLSLILITLKERHYESCWPLLYHFKSFLEALGSHGSDTAISNCLNQVLKNETKMIEMSTDDFESFSDGSLFGFDMNEEVYRPLLDSQDKSTGVNILEVASLNYVLSAIEYAMQCQGKHGNLCGKIVYIYLFNDTPF